MGALDSFRRGLAAALEGLRLAFGSAEIRRSYLWLVLLLLLGSTLLTGLGGWAVWHFTTAPAGAGWMWATLYITLRVLGLGLVVVLAPVLSLGLINALAPVFNERPFFAGLAAIDPGRAEALRAMGGLGTATAIGVGLRRLLRLLSLQLLALLIAVVPVVGSIAGPLFGTAAAAFMVGWELLDPYYARLGLRFREQAAQAATDRWAIMGFGLPFALAFAVPIIGPTLFAAAQAAVARLVVDVLPAPAVFASPPAPVQQKT